MPSQRSIAPVIVVGSVAASATTGALIAIGHRLGGIGIPFASISASLLHRTASSSSAGLIVAGLILHIVATFLWTAIYMWLVRTLRWRADVAAIAVGAGAYVLTWLAAWSTGGGLASALALGDRLVLTVVLAGALVVGMRFAFSDSQSSQSA